MASSIKAKLIDIVGVWAIGAPQSQLLGASLDLNLALISFIDLQVGRPRPIRCLSFPLNVFQFSLNFSSSIIFKLKTKE